MEQDRTLRAHQARKRIIDGTLRGAALRELILSVPARDRDAWTDEILGIAPPPPDAPDLPLGSVPYLPCGVDEILALVRDVPIRSDDVFVDLGAGLGRVAILVHLLRGTRTGGIEIQDQLVWRAQDNCAALGLVDVSFVHADAAAAVLDGSVFFLYAPFNGAILRTVLQHLEELARVRLRLRPRVRPIVVCSVGLEFRDVAWLKPMASSLPSLSLYCAGPD